MESSDTGVVHLHSVRRLESLRMDTGISLDPEQEQQDNSEPDTQSESNQGTPEPKNNPPPQTFIGSRIQQLQHRRFLLLKMQQFRQKAEDNSNGTTEEMTSEDSDELEAIQKELEELLVKKERLEQQGKLSQQDVRPTFYKTETPYGGIYMLPPPQLEQEDSTPEQRVKTRPGAERPTGLAVPVDSLDKTPAVSQCPSCREVIFTETSNKAGETVWMVCCLCSMMGCVAGCCVLPFFMGCLKNVEHQCPQCQAHIHTYKPF